MADLSRSTSSRVNGNHKLDRVAALKRSSSTMALDRLEAASQSRKGSGSRSGASSQDVSNAYSPTKDTSFMAAVTELEQKILEGNLGPGEVVSGQFDTDSLHSKKKHRSRSRGSYYAVHTVRSKTPEIVNRTPNQNPSTASTIENRTAQSEHHRPGDLRSQRQMSMNSSELNADLLKPPTPHDDHASAKVAPLTIRKRRGQSMSSYQDPPSPRSGALQEQRMKGRRTVPASVTHSSAAEPVEELPLLNLGSSDSLEPEIRSQSPNVFVSAPGTPMRSKSTANPAGENRTSLHVRNKESDLSFMLLDEPTHQKVKAGQAVDFELSKTSASSRPLKPVEPVRHSDSNQHSPLGFIDVTRLREESASITGRPDQASTIQPPGSQQILHLLDNSSASASVKGSRSNDTSANLVSVEPSDTAAFEVSESQRPRSPSLPTNLGSPVQHDLIELLQKANRARMMIFGPTNGTNDFSRSDSTHSRDIQPAQTWVEGLSRFLRSKLSKDQLQSDHLTARPLRKSRSYFDQYSSVRGSEDIATPESVDGNKSRLPSEDVYQQNEKILASLKSDRLESIIKELESVIEDALEKAANSEEEYDPEIHKELQDIAASLKPPEPAHTANTKAGLSGIGKDDPDNSMIQAKEGARPVARMKRIVKDEGEDPDELRVRLQEYHRSLLKVHGQKMSPHVFGDRAESYQRAAAPKKKDEAVPLFLQDSSIDELGGFRSRAASSAQALPFKKATTWNSQRSKPLLAKAGLGEPITEKLRSISTPQSPGRADTVNPIESKQTLGPGGKYPEISPEESLSQHMPSSVYTHDWARSPWSDRTQDYMTAIEVVPPPEHHPPAVPEATRSTGQEKQGLLYRPTPKELKKYMKKHSQPPVQPRESSMRRRSANPDDDDKPIFSSEMLTPEELDSDDDDYIAEFGQRYDLGHLNTDGTGGKVDYGHARARRCYAQSNLPDKEVMGSRESNAHEVELDDLPRMSSRKGTKLGEADLARHRHLSFRGRRGFSLHKSHKRAPIARDWSDTRKRFVAFVACVSTALVGMIIGVYAGEAPALQYSLVDEYHHFIYLGNVMMYLGLAISNFLFWPLPLLHGRKPYTLSALVLTLPMIFPQAVAVIQQRDPADTLPRVGLLLPRFLAGLALGFANMNFFGTLLDVFGASLMSGNPHQEVVNPYDARRHGGGMGVWLSIWTWCYIGSIGFGFFIGALIIGYLNVSWGFWITIFSTVVCILLNVISPETRRSAYRRSMAEVRSGTDVSRRVARGEVMMHLYSTGPKYWWQEMLAGWVLSIRMLGQVGFVIFAAYQAWIYGQVVMVMILLGALTSKYYHLLPHDVALSVAAFPLGALAAVPFQKASIFSRARHHPQRTDSMTFEKKVVWTSHMARRTVFMVMLPLAGLAYTLSSAGVKTPLALPITFAAVIGFLSNLALSECQGIMMENYDTSDLQPGMTGRPRTANNVSDHDSMRRTNFSCFPRVTAAFAIVQSMSFVVAAAATSCGGNVERALGAQAATACVAGVLLLLTLLLVAALVRFKQVQIVPSKRVATAILSGPGENLPVVIGNPSGTMRRICLLELGAMTRWTEIRRKNKLL
ncbi:MAG: hypothetical protein MMC23_008005 [Stictis urceolatum]|nr:hypothetical protein [Stictis urceolata]